MGDITDIYFYYFFYYWGYKLGYMIVKLVVFMVWIVCSFATMMVISGCDYRSNKILTEQSTTFEKELAYKQRTQNELEIKLRKAQEDIEKLEKQLECRDDNE